jgi:hypothetical protein
MLDALQKSGSLGFSGVLVEDRWLYRGNGTNGGGMDLPRPNPNVSNSQQAGQGTYDFLAFIIWYMFLVLCCIIPTCCAYRRRRVVEARLTEEQARMAMQRMEMQQQQPSFILFDQLHAGGRFSSERLQTVRTEKLREELKETSMVCVCVSVGGAFDRVRVLVRSASELTPQLILFLSFRRSHGQILKMFYLRMQHRLVLSSRKEKKTMNRPCGYAYRRPILMLTARCQERALFASAPTKMDTVYRGRHKRLVDMPFIPIASFHG